MDNVILEGLVGMAKSATTAIQRHQHFIQFETKPRQTPSRSQNAGESGQNNYKDLVQSCKDSSEILQIQRGGKDEDTKTPDNDVKSKNLT